MTPTDTAKVAEAWAKRLRARSFEHELNRPWAEDALLMRAAADAFITIARAIENHGQTKE